MTYWVSVDLRWLKVVSSWRWKYGEWVPFHSNSIHHLHHLIRIQLIFNYTYTFESNEKAWIICKYRPTGLRVPLNCQIIKVGAFEEFWIMWLVMVTSYATLQSKAGDDEAHLQRGCEPGVTMIDLPPAGQGQLQHCAFRHVAHAFQLLGTFLFGLRQPVSLLYCRRSIWGQWGGTERRRERLERDSIVKKQTLWTPLLCDTLYPGLSVSDFGAENAEFARPSGLFGMMLGVAWLDQISINSIWVSTGDRKLRRVSPSEWTSLYYSRSQALFQWSCSHVDVLSLLRDRRNRVAWWCISNQCWDVLSVCTSVYWQESRGGAVAFVPADAGASSPWVSAGERTCQS